VAGPKRRIRERLAGFPDLTTTIEDMFSVHDKNHREACLARNACRAIWQCHLACGPAARSKRQARPSPAVPAGIKPGVSRVPAVIVGQKPCHRGDNNPRRSGTGFPGRARCPVLPAGPAETARLGTSRPDRLSGIGPYGGVEATGKQVQVRDFAVWRFEDGKVAKTSTIHDQFALLKQIGYLREEVYAAQPGVRRPRPAERPRRSIPGQEGCGPGSDLERADAMSTQRVTWRRLSAAAVVAMNRYPFRSAGRILRVAHRNEKPLHVHHG
jgi:SnoaL-like polyketide cyclase